MSSFCVNTDETHSSEKAILFSFQTEWKRWVIFDTMAYQRLPEYQISSHYSKSVSCENSKCLHFATVQKKHIVQNRPFFSHSKQNERKSYLTQWHTKGFHNIKLVSLYSKSVSCENSKCLHFASVPMKHIVQKRQFFSHFKQNEKNESYLTQWHTKSFHNFKLVSLYSKSVSCENSICLHFASVQMKHIVQKRPFFSHSKQNEKNESYLRQWHTKSFQNIKLVSLYSESVSFENSKCLHFASVQMKHIVKKGHLFLIPNRMKKISHIWHNGIPKASRISN